MRQLAELKQRLKAARKRAAYWSGRPSFSGFGFNPRCRSTGESDTEYETAMDDLQSIADEIERLTGKRPATTDYREEWRSKYLQWQARIFSHPQEPPSCPT